MYIDSTLKWHPNRNIFTNYEKPADSIVFSSILIIIQLALSLPIEKLDFVK